MVLVIAGLVLGAVAALTSRSEARVGPRGADTDNQSSGSRLVLIAHETASTQDVCKHLSDKDLFTCDSVWRSGAAGHSRVDNLSRLNAGLRASFENVSWSVVSDSNMLNPVYDETIDPTPKTFGGRFSFEQSVRLFGGNGSEAPDDPATPQLASTLRTPRRSTADRVFNDINIAGGELKSDRRGAAKNASSAGYLELPDIQIADDFSQGNMTSQTLVVQHDNRGLGVLSAYAGGCLRKCRSETNFYFASPGSNVTIYAIDTPIEDNVQFKQVQTGESRLDAMGFAAEGLDGQQVCLRNHGTHAAAAAGGYEFGTAKDVDIVSVGVQDGCDSGAPVSQILAGLDWLEDHYDVHVAPDTAIAMFPYASMGDDASALVADRILALSKKGVAFAVSAGNFHADACAFTPANESDVMTVGGARLRANALAMEPWAWTNFGRCVDIFAPAYTIESASAACYDCASSLSSTSIATARVAGVMAQYLETNPRASPAEVKRAVLEAATNQLMTKPEFPYRTTTRRVVQSLLNLNVFEVSDVVDQV